MCECVEVGRQCMSECMQAWDKGNPLFLLLQPANHTHPPALYRQYPPTHPPCRSGAGPWLER